MRGTGDRAQVTGNKTKNQAQIHGTPGQVFADERADARKIENWITTTPPCAKTARVGDPGHQVNGNVRGPEEKGARTRTTQR